MDMFRSAFLPSSRIDNYNNPHSTTTAATPPFNTTVHTTTAPMTTITTTATTSTTTATTSSSTSTNHRLDTVPLTTPDQRNVASNATIVYDMMLAYFWKNTDKNKRSDIYDSLTLRNAVTSASDHRAGSERLFRKHVYEVLGRTFPWILSVDNVRVCVSDQRSVLPIEILIPRRAAYTNESADLAFVGRVLYDQYKSVIDPYDHVTYLVRNHPKLVERYPMFWSYVFLKNVPAYNDYVEGDWSDEKTIFSSQTYQAGWLNADAITMLASTVTNLPFGGTGGVGEEPVALGVRAMYNLELFSSAYNGDYLFTAAAIRNAYKFAYDSCLYVPRGVATAELRSLKKREVLLGVRQPTISDVVNDINNVKTSSVMVYLDGTVRKKRGGGIASGGVGCLKASGLQEDVVEKIVESVESTVKTILPRLCETIGIPSVIANAMTATKKIRLLDVLRTVDNVLFQHSDWEERINRGLAAIPSLINNITNEPIVSFVPSKTAYTHVPTGSTLELPGFDNSIVLSTHLDPETNKRFCPLKFILQEPFLYLNKGSGRYFTHSSGGHPMPFTQVEGLRILYHFLVQ